jgi:hypothetical protein
MLEGLTTDDLLMGLAIVAILVPLAIWGLRKYQTLMADGKLDLGEVLDAVEEGVDKVEQAKEDVEEIIIKAKEDKKSDEEE